MPLMRGLNKPHFLSSRNQNLSHKQNLIQHALMNGIVTPNSNPLHPDLPDSIWIFLKEQWDLNILLEHKQYVHSCILNRGGLCLYTTFVYADNSRDERRELWSGMLRIKQHSANQ